jgi:hypothetical protein
MAKSKSIVKPHLTPSSLNIPAAVVPPDDYVRFSFKHLDLVGNPKFSLTHCGHGYLEKFLCRLRDICMFTISEFRENKSPSLRAHKITWGETSERYGFTSLNSQLKQKEAWQFEISKVEHGRVHGIIIDNVFYVVWIDPAHNLYSRQN